MGGYAKKMWGRLQYKTVSSLLYTINVKLVIHWDDQHPIRYGQDSPGRSRYTILTLFAKGVITIWLPRWRIGSLANKPHNRSEVKVLHTLMMQNRMTHRPMHRRWQKPDAMCIRLRWITWSARKISRCDVRRTAARITLSFSTMYNVHVMHRYRYCAFLHIIVPVYGSIKNNRIIKVALIGNTRRANRSCDNDAALHWAPNILRLLYSNTNSKGYPWRTIIHNQQQSKNRQLNFNT